MQSSGGHFVEHHTKRKQVVRTSILAAALVPATIRNRADGQCRTGQVRGSMARVCSFAVAGVELATGSSLARPKSRILRGRAW